MTHSRRTSPGARALPLFALAALIGPSTDARADGVSTTIELGAVWASRNDVRIPSTGSPLSLVDDLTSGAAPVYRARLNYRRGRHLWSALYAPLRVSASGSAPSDLDFAGEEFADGDPLYAVYRFDSYRLTYRYAVVDRPELRIEAGITGKVRDAEISLYSGTQATKTDTGFVPLASFQLRWRPARSRVGLLVDGDALVGPQGRAEDVLVAATWELPAKGRLYAGYRTLEGGADVEAVYNFSWFHYLVVGMELGL